MIRNHKSVALYMLAVVILLLGISWIGWEFSSSSNGVEVPVQAVEHQNIPAEKITPVDEDVVEVLVVEDQEEEKKSRECSEGGGSYNRYQKRCFGGELDPDNILREEIGIDPLPPMSDEEQELVGRFHDMDPEWELVIDADIPYERDVLIALKEGRDVTVQRYTGGITESKEILKYTEKYEAVKTGNLWADLLPSVSLSPDGLSLAYGKGGALAIYDMKSRASKDILTKEEGEDEAPPTWNRESISAASVIQKPEWSRDGSNIILEAGFSEGAGSVNYSLVTGEIEFFSTLASQVTGENVPVFRGDGENRNNPIDFAWSSWSLDGTDFVGRWGYAGSELNYIHDGKKYKSLETKCYSRPVFSEDGSQIYCARQYSLITLDARTNAVVSEVDIPGVYEISELILADGKLFLTNKDQARRSTLYIVNIADESVYSEVLLPELYEWSVGELLSSDQVLLRGVRSNSEGYKTRYIIVDITKNSAVYSSPIFDTYYSKFLGLSIDGS